MEKRQNLILNIKIVLGLVILFSLIGGFTYAFFNYTRTGSTNTLLVGNIYFNHQEGTAINLINEFPRSREEARARNDNVIPIGITGLNESDRDVYYKFVLTYGDEVENGTRIDDDLLRFDLVKVGENNEETYILYNESFSSINDTVIYKNRVDAGTDEEIIRNYKLRMWIDESVKISDTDDDEDYTTSEWESVFATVKVEAIADFQNVYYYESFENGVAAVNAESYASETDRENAVAGIYIDSYDNSTNLVLYSDAVITQDTTISKIVDFNLYGYTLEDTTTADKGFLYLYLNGNSIIENGIVKGEYSNRSHSFFFWYNSETNILKNLDIQFDDENKNIKTIITTGNSSSVHVDLENVKISNAMVAISRSSFKATNIDLNGYVAVANGGFVELNDSYLYYDSGITVSVYDAASRLVIDNSSVISDGLGCYHNSNGFYNTPIGISNKGTLIFNSGHVFGLHSAVETDPGSKTYVYGGTFESTSHGGFYFVQGPTGVAYVENAIIRGIDYPSYGRVRTGTAPETIERNGQTYTLSEFKRAFYIGGNTTENGESVYLVNCTISSVTDDRVFVMRGSEREQNLYMSGCTIANSKASQDIRVDAPSTMKIYLGRGNNFGNINKVYTTETLTFAAARNAGILVDTNVDYKDIVTPQ